MKKGLLVLGMLFATGFAQEPNKLYVSRQYGEHGDRILFIEDKETGTRCYAITSNDVTIAGYAISCVKK